MDARTMERRLRHVCDEAERRVRSGDTRVAEALLSDSPELATDENAVLEVIYAEYVARRQLGQPVNVGEYYARFARWHERLERLFGIDEALQSQTDEPVPLPRDRGSPIATTTTDWVGQYRVLETIGAGGMGVVYRARHEELGRIAAVKVIRSPGASADEIERFHCEAESMASLQHTNVVQVYEVGSHGGCPFLAMEYVDGGSLTERMASGTMSLHDAARLIETLARAIAQAHRQGIVHRDLKPANVLLTRESVPKLSDFGLAKQLDRADATKANENALTHTGAIMGTPSYMAPEQALARREGIGPAVDIYALGAILYETLTGRPPFRGGSPLDTLRLIQTAEPISPRRLHPHLPRDLETICLKCLEKDPHNRYPTAAALADDLRHFREGRAIQARPVSYVGQMVKWATRRPAIAALSASLVSVALLGVAGIFWQWRRAESGRQTEMILRADAEANLYYHRITAAQSELVNVNITRAREVLAQCEPRFRHWEWHYLNRLCNRQVLELAGHKLPVTGAVFSPDGTRLFSVTGAWGTDGPGELKIWNTSTGDEEVSVAVPGALMDIAVDSTGKRIATAATWFRDVKRRWREPAVRIWDARTGEQVGSLPAPIGGVASVAFSPDGRQFATGGSDQVVRVFDSATGEEIHTLRGATLFITAVAFTSDAARLAAASRDGTVRVWDLTTGEEIFVGRPELDMRGAAFSTDDDRLVTVGYSGSLWVWDPASPRERLAYRVRDHALLGVCFSPDGKLLASGGSEGQVYVWDSRSMREVMVLRGHDATINSVRYSSDGRFLASASSDRTVKVWDMHTEDEPATYAARKSDIACLAYSPDGRFVALGSAASEARGVSHGSKAVRVWDVHQSQESIALDGHGDWVPSVAYNHDGTRLATGSLDKTIKIWNPSEGDCLLTLTGHSEGVSVVAFTPDGNQVASGSDEGSIKLWDANVGKLLRSWRGHDGSITTISMSPDGEFFVTGSDDRTVKVWSVDGGDLVRSIELRDPVRGAAVGPNARYLALCAGETVYLYRADDVAVRPTILAGHTRTIDSLSFTPDGRRLASASRDGTIKIWDVVRGQEAITLESKFRRALCAFSPDGRTLASSWGSRLCLWGTDWPDAPARAPSR